MKRIFALIAVLAAFYACNKQEIEPLTTPDGKQIITATVTIPDTKVAYEENTPGGGSGLTSSWEAGDRFYAIQKTGDDVAVVTFTLTGGAGSSSGKFQTETSGVTAATEWTAILGNGAIISGEEIHCSYKNQTGSLAAIDDFNYVKATGSGTNPTFSFETGAGLSYIMRIKLPAGIKCIEYTPCAWWKVTSDEVQERYYVDEGSFEDSSDGKYIYSAWLSDNTPTINLGAPSTSGQIVYIAVPAINYSVDRWVFDGGTQNTNMKTGVIITVLNDTSDNATLSGGSVLDEDLSSKGGKIGTFDISGWTLISRPKPSDAIHFTTNNMTESDGFSTTADYETYWAPFNVGASVESEVGNYYAWGEFKAKAEYTYVTYAYRHKPDGVNMYYDIIPHAANAGKNYFTIRNSRYDVARVQWGKAWRMPGFFEAYTLNKHTASKVTISGVSGMKIIPKTGDTGKYIFFPSCGTMQGTEKVEINANRAVSLWTGDTYRRKQTDGDPYKCAYVYGSNNSSWSSADWWRKDMKREWGMPVRAVLSSSTQVIK